MESVHMYYMPVTQSMSCYVYHHIDIPRVQQVWRQGREWVEGVWR